MIRKVSYRLSGNGDWRRGVIHTFTMGQAVVEDDQTGELILVGVAPENLKFECKIEEWTKLQQEAQQRQMAAQVLAVPGANFRTGRG